MIFEDGICRYNRKMVNLGGGDEHAITRILGDGGQLGRAGAEKKRVTKGNRRGIKSSVIEPQHQGKVVFDMDDPFVRPPKLDGVQPQREKNALVDRRATVPRVILVSGPKHSGKTTLVETGIASLAGRGLRIAGILAKGLWKDGLRAGFDLVNLSNGRCTPLARRRDHPHPEHRMMFDFFDAGFRAGVEAMSLDACRQADIVVVDELGRLEAGGRGWTPCVNALLALEGPLLVLVVRLDRLPQIRDRFGLHDASAIDVRDPAAADRLRAALAVGSTRQRSLK
jgi:nucleoside-triphosphatase THEP1